jgi:hypothetical protein
MVFLDESYPVAQEIPCDHLRLKVLTAVALKGIVSWDVTLRLEMVSEAWHSGSNKERIYLCCLLHVGFLLGFERYV